MFSGGGLSPRQQIPVTPNYQVGFAARIRKEVKMPVIAVGLITEAQQAEKIISSGQADMVAAGARHASTTHAGRGMPLPN